jgi:hypothetical protein
LHVQSHAAYVYCTSCKYVCTTTRTASFFEAFVHSVLIQNQFRRTTITIFIQTLFSEDYLLFIFLAHFLQHLLIVSLSQDSPWFTWQGYRQQTALKYGSHYISCRVQLVTLERFLLFIVSGFFSDLLILRLALTLDRAFLLVQALSGFPSWLLNYGDGPWQLPLDVVIWTSLNLYVQIFDFLGMNSDERPIRICEGSAPLWRMMYRRGGFSQLLFKEYIEKKFKCVRIKEGETHITNVSVCGSEQTWTFNSGGIINIAL